MLKFILFKYGTITDTIFESPLQYYIPIQATLTFNFIILNYMCVWGDIEP